MSPNSMIGVLIKRRDEDTHTYTHTHRPHKETGKDSHLQRPQKKPTSRMVGKSICYLSLLVCGRIK